MEALVQAVASWTAIALETIAVLMVAAGALGALAHVVMMAVRRRVTERQMHATFISFGRWLVAALSFQLGADIVSTTVAPDWDELGRLAALAGIRTFLSYFLDRDLTRARQEEQAEEALAGVPPEPDMQAGPNS